MEPDDGRADGEVEPAPKLRPAALGSAGTPEVDPLDPLLDAAIARDLRRGRRLATLSWPIALLHGVLGFVAIQQSAHLAGVDHRLASTPDVEALGASFIAIRIALVFAIGVVAVMTVRWLQAAVATAEALVGLGAIEGGGRGRPGLRGVGVLFRAAGVAVEQVSWAEVRVGSGHGVARGAGLAVVVAAGVGAAAVVASLVASGAESARTAFWIAGVDAGLWIVATLLLGAVASDVAWRIAVAGRAVGHFAPLADAPGRPLVRLAPAVLMFLGLVPIAATVQAAADVPCNEATSLTCSQVVVPVDHDGPARQAVISVVYGVHHATYLSKGTFVVAVGGPGGSGLATADMQIDAFDPRLVDNYDIVFWDQRGVGRSDGHDCPFAGGIYANVEPTETSARAFVDSCLKEADTGSVGLGRYSTRQAAEDLEAIRARLGVERIVLYGQSYGTELAQIYAAAHPDRLSALILDGAVDLSLTANQFWGAAARGFDSTLSATFDDCDADTTCRSEIAEPGRVFDRLVERLGRKPETLSYRDLAGQLSDHRLEGARLESAAGSLMYEPTGRALLLRALAASEGGDDVPIARLTDLFGPGIGGAVSSFAYHAILCADYRVSPTDNTADMGAVLAAGTSSGALAGRLREVYFAQLPCLYWPQQPRSAERPAPLTDQPEPIFVLGATLDPITPIGQGRLIARRARDGYLIESSGGPHVTFGRGNDCVDGAMLDYLIDGRLPASRTTYCDDVVASRFIPLHPLRVGDYADALDAMTSIADELFAEPIYSLWTGDGILTIGCRFGGSFEIHGAGDRDDFTFEGCEFAQGIPLDGSGGYDLAKDSLRLDVTFPDGSLRYTSETARHVTGTFRGRTVDQRG